MIYDLVLPPFYSNDVEYQLLILNDGQDFEKIQVRQALANFWKLGGKHFVLAGVHSNKDRLSEYGTEGILDSKGRGEKAGLYQKFLVQEFLPKLQLELSILSKGHVLCGFSLGGLSALDIVWGNPQIFDVVGVFSGAFWWRSRDYGKDYRDETDRIMHGKIKNGTYNPNLKFWFECGTQDEKADRNKNGIIDSIDDTKDLIKELIVKGYDQKTDIYYLEIENGEHNHHTWAKAMPQFLRWAFEH